MASGDIRINPKMHLKQGSEYEPLQDATLTMCELSPYEERAPFLGSQPPESIVVNPVQGSIK